MSLRLLGCLVVALVLTPLAAAQQWQQSPLFGSVELRSGFTPDPHSVEITAGGSTRNPVNGADCVGFIAADQPDFNVDYSAGSVFDLTIYVHSGSDTALLIRTPDGEWTCNRDHDGLNPSVRFSSPSSGTYHVWVATVSGGTAPATLFVSELGYRSPNQASARDQSRRDQPSGTGRGSTSDPSGLCVDCNPTSHGFSLRAGFTPDPLRLPTHAGGPVQNPVSGPDCRGRMEAAPNVVFDYVAGRVLPLVVYTEGDTDTTLLVRDPSGNWHCDDDSGRSLNARLVFEGPESGVYAIWVGRYGNERLADVVLHISEFNRQRD